LQSPIANSEGKSPLASPETGEAPGGRFKDMGTKKKRIEKLERHVERKFLAFSLMAIGLVAMIVLLALLGNK
jgi:hypothetical protein